MVGGRWNAEKYAEIILDKCIMVNLNPYTFRDKFCWLSQLNKTKIFSMATMTGSSGYRDTLYNTCASSYLACVK